MSALCTSCSQDMVSLGYHKDLKEGELVFWLSKAKKNKQIYRTGYQIKSDGERFWYQTHRDNKMPGNCAHSLHHTVCQKFLHVISPKTRTLNLTPKTNIHTNSLVPVTIWLTAKSSFKLYQRNIILWFGWWGPVGDDWFWRICFNTLFVVTSLFSCCTLNALALSTASSTAIKKCVCVDTF